jgi:lipopolysaccharide export LptBFGC system permease protein LptF
LGFGDVDWYGWLGDVYKSQAFGLVQDARRNGPPGSLLTRFFLAYFIFRFLEEFIRPHPIVAGLTPFQWICIAGTLILLIKAILMRPSEKVSC